MNDLCRQEVEELHRFFQAWFLGAVDRADPGLRRAELALAPEFRIATPSGIIMTRKSLLESLHMAWGVRSRDSLFRLGITDYEGRSVPPAHHLATYREWQVDREGSRGRLATALFRRRSGTPLGVEWIHVHECWLAAD